MSSQQPNLPKKRKSNEANSIEQAAAETTNQTRQSTMPSPPHYYASPQRYATQYSHHGGYSFANAQQYPYHPSQSHGYGNLPPSGYHAAVPLHASIHGNAHHLPLPTNTFITPENQQHVTSSAFISPPSSLRRHPNSSSSSGKSRACKFIHFLFKMTVFVRSDCLN